jgi:hypothetical protein
MFEDVLMADFIKLNGTPVRTTGLYQRSIAQPGGPPLAEVELVIIIRGSMANRSLRQLLAAEPVRVDLPGPNTTTTFDAAIEDVQVSSSGTGEAAAYRFDLKLRETPESAAQRAAAGEIAESKDAAKSHEGPFRYERKEIVDDNPSAPLDYSKITTSGDSAVWATALKQLTTPQTSRVAAPPEPPLTEIERASVEAVLVNLRLDALINMLEFTGQVRRVEVESTFMQIVKDKFVSEATPLVGEKVAKRALRDLLG